MGDVLTLYRGDGLTRARQWAELDEPERRRRSVRACRDRDATQLWDLLEAHLILTGSAGSHISEHTKAAYKRGLVVLLEAWAGVNLLRPPKSAAALWIRSQEAQGLAPATIQVRLAGARALYRALRWAGALDGDPLADVRPAKDPTPAWEKRQPCSETELTRMLAVAGPVDRALIALGSQAGLRIAEILGLKWSEVELSAGRLIVAKGKGGRKRSVPISGTLRAALSDLPQRFGYVIPFRSAVHARHRIRVVCQAAGTEYRAAHSLRHAVGARVLKASDLQTVAEILGHSSLDTARRYSHFNDDKLKALVSEW